MHKVIIISSISIGILIIITIITTITITTIITFVVAQRETSCTQRTLLT